jgi:hypothetical protein
MREWTKPKDLTEQVLRLWDKGRILAAKVTGEPLFPLSLRLHRPEAAAYSGSFEDVRKWIRTLEDGSRTKRGFGYDVEWSDVNHRQLGRNRIPRAVTLPTETDALKLIGRENEFLRFGQLLKATTNSFPDLLGWLARKPLMALDHAADWARVLSVLGWFKEHPQSSLYLRQLDIEGVDTKFIETRKPLLTELLDIVLRRVADPQDRVSAQTFEQSYGLRSRPPIIRFRVLDESLAIGSLLDIATPAAQFASLRIPAKRVFITENEVNGLAFPSVAESIVVFGLGYGLDLLSQALWMRECDIHYWGDLDTHGFAMLDKLRAAFPAARSLLMDRETLLTHRALWGREVVPFRGALTRLKPDERELFDALTQNLFGQGIRLEQERISFRHVRKVIWDIAGETPSAG